MMYSSLARGRIFNLSQTLFRIHNGVGLRGVSTAHSLGATSSVYAEEMFELWKQDPKRVHQSWDQYFSQLSHESRSDRPQEMVHRDGQRGTLDGESANAVRTLDAAGLVEKNVRDHMAVQALVRSYQVSGHIIADIDPLGLEPKRTDVVIRELQLASHGLSEKDLDRVFTLPTTTQIGGKETALPLRDIIARLDKTYCRTMGIQFMYMPKRDHADWIRRRFETPNILSLTDEERKVILHRLVKATYLEEFLAKKWPAEKRFGLEGCESFVPGLQTVIDTSSALGVDSIVMGLAHRGRLNVIANVCEKPMQQVFAQFKSLSLADEGSGDVKYHLGLSHEFQNDFSGRPVRLSMCANPSHLEAVNPVVQGKTRAEQFYRGDEMGDKVMSVIVHGDAAFAGQGIVYETFHLSELPDYTTHGTVHIVINNQIGFTTDPRVARSSPYCTDVARVVNAPIFHVNADDPEAVHHVCKAAAEWRAEFRKDVVIDLVGYRRNGHNEIDEPKFTQPIMYGKIQARPNVLQLYSERLIKAGIVDKKTLESDIARYVMSLDADFQNAGKETHVRNQDWLDSPWPKSFVTERDQNSIPLTGVEPSTLAHISSVFSAEPQGYTIHRGIKRILEGRRKMAETQEADWAMGEALAWGSLLQEGIHVRLSGQDVERGTFSHRHHVLHDQEKDKTTYRPLNHLDPNQAPYTVCNSSLSEFGVLGFDLGFSMTNPNALIMWEAQFGDFVNTAQCMIDQFISSGYAKWRNQTGLVMLLPHGHEGMGPEHTSGQLERFLQLSSDNPDDFQSDFYPSFVLDQLKCTNWQVMNLTTPANYFHAMRRQVAMPIRRPMVIMTPKSLLKFAEARSSFVDMAVGTEFKRVYPDTGLASENPANVSRVILCSGKVFYELRKEIEGKGLADNIALIRVEQICPFPYDLVKKEMQKYSEAKVVWVQEEHQNRGAWAYIQPRINNLLRLHMQDPRQISYIGRTASASPATGNKKQHLKEQAHLLTDAVNIPASTRLSERRRSSASH